MLSSVNDLRIDVVALLAALRMWILTAASVCSLRQQQQQQQQQRLGSIRRWSRTWIEHCEWVSYRSYSSVTGMKAQSRVWSRHHKYETSSQEYQRLGAGERSRT